MKKLFVNVKEIIKAEKNPKNFVSGKEMQSIGRISDAFLLIEKDKIIDFGKMSEINKELLKDNSIEICDLQNNHYILPTFNDSHTHLVFAASREGEFVDKIKGLSYEAIALRGGGIINSAKKIHEIGEDELYEVSKKRIYEIMKMGTGAVEIKSGYGLNIENELKMLRVIKKLKETMPITIVPTFLAAHSFPLEYRERRSEYVDMIISEMIPIVAAEELAEFIDVFCETGFFSVEDTDRILTAAQKYEFRPKIHANQLAVSGGVQVGVKFNALSVDHLENITDVEIEALKGTETMPTILPGCALFLNLPITPARRMIDSGLPVAFASDYNPGSSPSGNMKLVMSLASIRYQLLPEEALNAVTLNTAYAMEISETHGSITPGKQASFIITEPMPSFEFFAYSFGNNLIDKVYINGQEIK